MIRLASRSFGEYVTQAREKHGYSIRQLAAQVGVAPSTVMRIEDGTHAVPHPDLFASLIEALDLDVGTAMRLVGPYRRLHERITAQRGGGDG